MTYKIKIDKQAQKFILKQTKKKRDAIYKAIYKLPLGDVMPLEGHRGLNRLRVGDYRVIYTIDNGELIICVVDAGNRGDIYKRY